MVRRPHDWGQQETVCARLGRPAGRARGVNAAVIATFAAPLAQRRAGRAELDRRDLFIRRVLSRSHRRPSRRHAAPPGALPALAEVRGAPRARGSARRMLGEPPSRALPRESTHFGRWPGRGTTHILEAQQMLYPSAGRGPGSGTLSRLHPVLAAPRSGAPSASEHFHATTDEERNPCSSSRPARPPSRPSSTSRARSGTNVRPRVGARARRPPAGPPSPRT